MQNIVFLLIGSSFHLRNDTIEGDRWSLLPAQFRQDSAWSVQLKISFLKYVIDKKISGNLTPSAVYVTSARLWKIGGFSFSVGAKDGVRMVYYWKRAQNWKSFFARDIVRVVKHNRTVCADWGIKIDCCRWTIPAFPGQRSFPQVSNQISISSLRNILLLIRWAIQY